MENLVIENGILKKVSGVCYSLTVPDGITAVGDSAFMFKLRLRDVVLPDGLLRIEGYAFYGCKDLCSLRLPASLRYIGTSAFRNCVNLHEIFFSGTKSQWTSIKKEGSIFEPKSGKPAFVDCDWDYYFGRYTIHCADGDLTKD